MAFYNKSGDGRGPRSFGAGRFSRDGAERELFTTTCAQCGNSCQVPFRPNGTKPVYCNNCFQRDERPDRPERPSFSRPRFDGGFANTAPVQSVAPNTDKFKVQLEMINSKLDRILKFVSPVVTIEPVVEEVPEPKQKKAKKKAA